jgi:class 3 adenylate cyclase/predicted ATPase
MMDFYAVLAQVIEILQREGRTSYRALKRQFALDDDSIEDLKEELIEARRLAVDENGRTLVWTGGAPAPQPVPPAVASSHPIAYTPRHLAERILAEQAALEAHGAPDGERKTITALFADIKGSMQLLEDLDPEEARQIIDPALQVMMDAVHRYEGYVAQSLGDGIFAFFGAPIAHEDHAQRALYAALHMQEGIAQYSQRLRAERGVNLEIRVGANTGEVVVRAIRTDDLHTDYVPIGHATSLAARLQSLATGGAIVVSAPTYTLTEGYFHYKPLGVAQIKGVSEPVELYEVVGVGPLRTRLEVEARRGLVRFVGRQGELAQVQHALEQSRGGWGQVVGVVGEPGVGKSRLVYECKLRVQGDFLVLETFSVSHSKAYPYLPLLELLEAYFQLTPQDEARRRREQVTGKLLTLDRSLEDTVPYVLALLGDTEATAQLAQMDPPLRRRRTFEAITRVLLRESLNQPLLLIIEDLHWLDSETEAWMQQLSERVPTAPILLLVNYRPEYQHAWGSKTYYTQLRLDPLGEVEAHELLSALLGQDSGLSALQDLILARTEGNPFFMEEMVQALLEQGILVREGTAGGQARLTRPLTALQLPPTVQGILAARIDRLPATDKALLQMLAVIGKEFPLGLVAQVVGQPEAEVQEGLAHLQRGEFIYEQPAFPEPEYTFKHALTQEVAYNSLLLERRRELHERTAQAVEALYPERLEEHASALAHHYQHSGNRDKAVEYLYRAGQQAVQHAAYTDGIAHLTAALQILQTLPDTVERRRQELLVQTTLGPALLATRGHAAPEVAQAYARAYELCQQVGEAPQLVPVLSGLWFSALGRAEFARARVLGEHLLDMGQRGPDPTCLLVGHAAMGVTLVLQSALLQARRHLEQAVAAYDPQQHGSLAGVHGLDYGMASHAWLGIGLALLGYPDQGRQHSEAALRLAREAAHPFTLASAMVYACGLGQLRQEGQGTLEQAEAVVALATDQGFTLRKAHGTMFRSWALARQGAVEIGLAQLRQALAAFRASGTALTQSWFLGLCAEVCGQAGQVEEGLQVLHEALACVANTGERFYEAELWRRKGELLQSGVWGAAPLESPSRHPHAAEAAACFQQALSVARHQQAKSLELRAAMSLARLSQQQGKRTEARELLAPVYGWFTEGFDTADLQEAQALLDALA